MKRRACIYFIEKHKSLSSVIFHMAFNLYKNIICYLFCIFIINIALFIPLYM